MNPVEIIIQKRNKSELSKDQIIFMINSYTKGKMPDYQFSAFLMAIYLNGMSPSETAALTEAMLHSGKIIDLSKIKGMKIDKHSTGGVSDNTSLVLAPIAAAAGINVPMISGRGLGHTGGTLDKLESIPGFSTDLSLKEYKNKISRHGAVLIGQTKDIAPADKLIYSLRDVTGTVESIPLITGSIMSKKLAEGIDGLVLDVKTGSGAFMKSLRDAKMLAESLTETAKKFNKKVIAFITDMNQPLGNYIGNWLEVLEAVKLLKGEYIYGMYEVTVNLSGAMIYLGKKASSIEEGIEKSKQLIENGKAFDKFLEIVKAQGGDVTYLKKPEKYPKSKFSKKVYASKNGYIKSIDNYQLGMISLELGAGRKTKEDKIDPKAGIIFYPSIGHKIKKGDLIAELFTDKKNVLDGMNKKLLESITTSKEKVRRPKLIKKILK